ncbi:MAG: DUF2760 domain-containing protein [Polyangiaceae bacterium]
MSDAEIPFFSRIWLSWLVAFRVLFDGALAARVVGAIEGREPAALPQAPASEPPPKRAPEPEAPKERDTTAALQLLALMQREGRLIDFLEEDVASFSDADIGAAARVVHEGCRKALREHCTLAPVRAEDEGAVITIEEAKPAQIKLTGNVEGKGPYKGTLKHKGWRCEELRLPVAVAGHDAHVLAQAELEL